MRKINFLLALLLLINVSCAKNELVQIETQKRGSFTLKVQTPADTKVAIDGASVKWDAEDEIYIVPVGANKADTMYLLNIDPASISADGKSAEFKGDFAPVEGSYIAVSGADVKKDEISGKIVVSRATSDQVADNDDTHLENDWIMKSNVFAVNSTDVPSVVFENMQSVLRFKIKMQDGVEDQNISKLIFKAEQSSFREVTLIDDAGALESSTINTDVVLNFPNTAPISSASEYTALIPIIWNSDISEVTGDFTVTLQTTDGNIEVAFPAKELTSGKLYNGTLICGEPHDEAAMERNALIAFYKATDGDNWTNNTNWCTDAPLNEWYGVRTNELGQVYGLGAFWENNIAGEIPAELGNLTNLEYLSLSDNQLTGEIPTELCNLVNLVTLYLSDNQLTGEIPAELGNLSSLSVLTLNNNMLTGQIPQSLLDNSRFNDFIFGPQLDGYNFGIEYSEADKQALVALYNAAGGDNWTNNENWCSNEPISTWYGVSTNGLGEIISLTLEGNNLQGEIPAEFGNLKDLEEIFLATNQLTGEIPVELGDLPNLKWLSLGGNQLTGKLPQSLIDNPNFKNFGLMPQQEGFNFDIEYSEVDRQALVALYEATGGDNWSNNENWCSDKPVTEWRGVSADITGRVISLYLSSYQLSGEIPAELGNLSKLEDLSLSGNELTGEIPSELGNLANLGYLHLSDNQLTGEIPSELGNLTNLKSLNLNSNDLSGEIPSELGNLSNLNGLPYENLNLSGNQLTGKIPESIKNHKNYSGFQLNPQQDGFGVTE